jgi:hypothetical protein
MWKGGGGGGCDRGGGLKLCDVPFRVQERKESELLALKSQLWNAEAELNQAKIRVSTHSALFSIPARGPTRPLGRRGTGVAAMVIRCCCL